MSRVRKDVLDQLSWISVRVVQTVASNDLPPEVFHYTSAAGLHGIVKSRSIYATDSRCLNDPDDGVYPIKTFGNVLLAVASETGHKGFCDDVVRPVLELLADPVTLTMHTRLFIVSFSERADDLAQWIAYAGDGTGFSFGVSPSGASTSPHFFAKVHYGDEAIGNIVRHEVSRQVRALDEGSDPQALAAQWIEAVLTARPFFKSEHYSHEDEWRLVFPHDARVSKRKIDTRPTSRGLVPYFPVTLSPSDDDEFPITSILAGPKGTTLGVRDLLAHSLVEPAQSQIPYRGRGT